MASWKFFLNNIEVEEPLGWDGIEFTAKRLSSHGMDQIFSTDVKFYDKGAKILKSYYDEFFVNADVTIKIQSDIAFNDGSYEFIGLIDFAIYEEHNVCDTDTFEVTVGILQDSFRDKFKNRSGIKVFIESTTTLDDTVISPLPYTQIRLHRQELLLTGTAKSLADHTSYIVTSGTYPCEFSLVLPFYWQASDFSQNYGSTFDTRGFRPYDCPNLYEQGNSPIFVNNGTQNRRIYYKACGDLTLKLSYTMGGDPAGQTSCKIYLKKWKPGQYQSSGSVIQEWTSPLLDFDVPLNVSYSFNGDIEIEPGWAFNFIIGYGAQGGYTYSETTITMYQDAILNIFEYNTDAKATFCNALYIENALRRIIHILTGDSNGLLSDAFSQNGNGCYWNNMITNGLRIRNARSPDQIRYSSPCDGSTQTPFNFGIQLSFNELFEGLNRIFCLGWGFEKVGNQYKIRIEPIEYFYQNNIATTCEFVGELTQSAMTNKLANQITMGYTDAWKNISLGGASAINTERNYYVNNGAMEDNSSSKLDLRSNFIGEGTAIEFSRRMQFYTDNGNSSDRPNDYSIFIIWVNRNTVVINDVQNTAYGAPAETGTLTIPPGRASVSSSLLPSFSGDVDDVYNMYHSPLRIACRWWKVIGMHTYGMPSPKLSFRSGAYQVDAGALIDTTLEPCAMIGFQYENANITPSMLNDYPISIGNKYLFRPIEIKFDYPQSLCDFLDLANNNPYEKVKLTSGSLSVSGFIQSIQNKPEDDSGGTTSFVLLASNIPDPEPPPPGIGPYNDAYNDAYL